MTAVQEKRFSYTAVWLFPQSEKSDRNVKKKRQGRQDMSRRKYWKDRIPVLFINGVGMVLLSVFLLLVGNSPDSVALILLVWILSLFVYLSVLCWRRKRKLDQLLELAKNLDERYLLAEMLPRTAGAEEEVYIRLFKMASKSMLEQIGDVKRDRQEYREYIEQWIHEIKTPITAMKLLCENHKSEFTRELMTEIEQTDRYTEQALYYARSEHTEKDYSVREIRLFDVIHQAIGDNKYFLMQNKAAIETEESDVTVCSDEKWIRFILNQLIVNAVKYRNGQPYLHFYAEKMTDQIFLYVEDHGIGIPANDLPRIFEKGFTGQNGRIRQNATGIGLYLCKRLCDKLGIGIDVKSGEEGTTVRLAFQMNHFTWELQKSMKSKNGEREDEC